MKKGFFTEEGQEQASLHTGCDCPFNKNGNIYCPRHKVQKTPSLQNLCQFDQRYFDLWEQGLGPLQRHKIVDKRKKRPGVHAKTKSSKCVSSRNYQKRYRGQGR